MAKAQVISVTVYRNGVWAHNGKTGVLAASKAQAIEDLLKLWPGDYKVVAGKGK